MSLRKREAVIFAVLTAAAAVGTLVSFFSRRPETSAPVFAGMEHYGSWRCPIRRWAERCGIPCGRFWPRLQQLR